MSAGSIRPSASAAAIASPPGKRTATCATLAGRCAGSAARHARISGGVSESIPSRNVERPRIERHARPLLERAHVERSGSGEDLVQHEAERVDVRLRRSQPHQQAAPAPCMRAFPAISSTGSPMRIARPKSMMRTRPRPSSMMLAGLRSRCSTPRACASPMPAHSWRATSRPFSRGSRPMRLTHGGERLAVDVLHRQVVPAIGLADVEDAADVRVHDARARAAPHA